MNKKLPSVVSLAILTTITVVMWVGLEIYRSIKTIPESNVPESVSQSLDPTLDTNLLNKLPERIYFDSTTSATTKLFSPEATSQSTATPSPTITPAATTTPSPSSQPTSTP